MPNSSLVDFLTSNLPPTVPRGTFSAAHIASIVDFSEYLWSVNSKLRLVGSSGIKNLIRDHIIDAMLFHSTGLLEPFESVYDIGTGAGLPGIILAILNPKIKFNLVDSKNRSIQFLSEYKRQFGCNNIELFNCPFESLEISAKLKSCGITKAFSPFDKLPKVTSKLLTVAPLFIFGTRNQDLSQYFEEFDIFSTNYSPQRPNLVVYRISLIPRPLL